jgi:hypothetical protein
MPASYSTHRVYRTRSTLSSDPPRHTGTARRLRYWNGQMMSVQMCVESHTAVEPIVAPRMHSSRILLQGCGPVPARPQESTHSAVEGSPSQRNCATKIKSNTPAHTPPSQTCSQRRQCCRKCICFLRFVQRWGRHKRKLPSSCELRMRSLLLPARAHGLEMIPVSWDARLAVLISSPSRTMGGI